MAELSSLRFVNTIGGRLPLENWSCLKTGVAGVLGEGSRRQTRSAGGSLRLWCKTKAARCILPNTGVGCVQRERSSNAGGAGYTSLSLCGCTAL